MKWALWSVQFAPVGTFWNMVRRELNKARYDSLTKLRWQISDLEEAESLEIWTDENLKQKESRGIAPEIYKSYPRVYWWILSYTCME